MISVLATAVVTPFMMADQSAAPVAAQEPVAYNWATQNAQNIVTEDDVCNGMTASSSFIAGAQQIDDWHMC